MARWKLNDLALENVRLSVVKPNLAWASYNTPIYLQKAPVGSPSRTPQPITLNSTIIGTDRFAMETSIRAEIEDTRVFRIKAVRPGDYLYDTEAFSWIVPNRLDIEDVEGIITCNISGFIDEKILYSAGFTTDFYGGGGTVTTTIDPQFCSRVIKIVMPTVTQVRVAIYTLPATVDLSAETYLNYSIKSNYGYASFNTFEFRLYTGANYFAFNTTTFSANAWSHQKFYVPDFTSKIGSPSLSSVTAVGVASRQSAGLTYDLYLGPIYKE